MSSHNRSGLSLLPTTTQPQSPYRLAMPATLTTTSTTATTSTSSSTGISSTTLSVVPSTASCIGDQSNFNLVNCLGVSDVDRHYITVDRHIASRIGFIRVILFYRSCFDLLPDNRSRYTWTRQFLWGRYTGSSRLDKNISVLGEHQKYLGRNKDRDIQNVHEGECGQVDRHFTVIRNRYIWPRQGSLFQQVHRKWRMDRLHKNGSTAPGTSRASYNLSGKSSGSCEACKITWKTRNSGVDWRTKTSNTNIRHSTGSCIVWRPRGGRTLSGEIAPTDVICWWRHLCFPPSGGSNQEQSARRPWHSSIRISTDGNSLTDNRKWTIAPFDTSYKNKVHRPPISSTISIAKCTTTANSMDSAEFPERVSKTQNGFPKYSHSDNGSAFTADVTKSFFQTYSITHFRSSFHNPKSQARLERSHKTIWLAIFVMLETYIFDS